MIKHMYVDNFKALNNFKIVLSEFSVLIGNNSSGKSTILQAMDFLKCCCTSTVTEYLSERSITISDICSQLSNKRTITFNVTFEFDGKEILWELSFSVEKDKDKIELRTEKISSDSEILLHYFGKNSYRMNKINKLESKKETIMDGEYKCSIISFIKEYDIERFPELVKIKKYFMQSEVLDLLSPKEMRKNSRGDTTTLGQSGERLPSYIKGLSNNEKEELAKLLKNVISRISGVKAIIKGRPGWVHLEVEETFGSKNIPVSSSNVSDGVLRLIALYSLKFIKKSNGMVLLDEIEDGINSDNIEMVITLLKQICHDNNLQIIITTHSMTLLDYIEKQDIIYITRSTKGNVISKRVFEIDEMNNKLEYLYPGEAILSTTNQELTEMIIKDISEED